MNELHGPRHKLLFRTACFLALASALLYTGYRLRRTSLESGSTDSNPSSAANASLAPRYPPGLWRLAPAQLDNVVLWPAHILITHRDAKPNTSPFSLEHRWQRAGKGSPHSRSREAAFALASSIAVELRVNPNRFAELAGRYSDDPATSTWKGSLGAVPAASVDPEILDVLAQLRLGEASRPLESAWGFHVFTREPPSPPEAVSAREILISYVGTIGWLAESPQLPPRSYADAAQLAQQVYERLRDEPNSFRTVAQEVSDGNSRLIGGEIGPWSTTDPGDEGRVVALLSRMKVGEIGRPLETPAGFRILQRTESIPVRQYTVHEISLAYGDAANRGSGHPSTRAQALAKLAEIAARLKRDRRLFSRYSHELCCTELLTWRGARGDPRLIAALSRAKADDIVGPVEFAEANRVGLYQLVDSQLGTQGHRAVDSAIFWPRTPDVEDFVLHADNAALAQVAANLTNNLEFTGGTEEEKQKLREYMGALSRRLTTSATSSERVEAVKQTRASVYTLLGAHGFTKFMNGVDAYLSELIVYRR
jgi:hypothetical protein